MTLHWGHNGSAPSRRNHALNNEAPASTGADEGVVRRRHRRESNSRIAVLQGQASVPPNPRDDRITQHESPRSFRHESAVDGGASDRNRAANHTSDSGAAAGRASATVVPGSRSEVVTIPAVPAPVPGFGVRLRRWWAASFGWGPRTSPVTHNAGVAGSSPAPAIAVSVGETRSTTTTARATRDHQRDQNGPAGSSERGFVASRRDSGVKRRVE
jgi:hypothetical protein